MRNIIEAEINNIHIVRDETKDFAMGEVYVRVQSLRVPNAQGPEITVKCGCVVTAGTTLQELQRDLLIAATDCLRLFADLPVEELQTALEKHLARSAKYRNPLPLSDPDSA
jgi:hypothetical protein